jgi:hypothetical protein
LVPFCRDFYRDVYGFLWIFIEIVYGFLWIFIGIFMDFYGLYENSWVMWTTRAFTKPCWWLMSSRRHWRCLLVLDTNKKGYVF